MEESGTTVSSLREHAMDKNCSAQNNVAHARLVDLDAYGDETDNMSSSCGDFLAKSILELQIEHKRVLSELWAFKEEYVKASTPPASQTKQVCHGRDSPVTATWPPSQSQTVAYAARPLEFVHPGADLTSVRSQRRPSNPMDSWDLLPKKLVLSAPCSRPSIADRAGSTEDFLQICRAQALSKRVREPEVDARSSSRMRVRSSLERIVKSPVFEIVFAMLILGNSLAIGIETHIAAKRVDLTREVYIVIFIECLNFCFLIEWLLRVLTVGTSFFRAGPDFYWNWFDTTVIMLSIPSILTVFHVAAGDGTQQGGGWAPNNLRAARILRLTRIIHIIRASKMLTFIRALRYLVFSIVSTLKSLVWAMVLLVLIFYTFGTVMTEAATEFRVHSAGNYDDEDLETLELFWGDLLTSILTLFMAISGGVSWIEPLEPVKKMGSLWVSLFVIYIGFTYFAVLNVVTGVFCEKAIQSAQDDQTTMVQMMHDHRTVLQNRLHDLFFADSGNKSGTISLDEFEAKMDDDKVRSYFASMCLDVTDVSRLFRLFDKENRGLVDLTELVLGCTTMKGTARGIDMLGVAHDTKMVKEQVRRIARAFDELFYEEDASMKRRLSRQ